MAVEEMLIAGLRMKGKYSDCGTGFARLGKAVGRYICGKSLCLYYDGEYREDDADYETFSRRVLTAVRPKGRSVAAMISPLSSRSGNAKGTSRRVPLLFPAIAKRSPAL